MKDYKFQIGEKTIQLSACSVDAAYNYAEEFARSYGWKGRILLIN